MYSLKAIDKQGIYVCYYYYYYYYFFFFALSLGRFRNFTFALLFYRFCFWQVH